MQSTIIENLNANGTLHYNVHVGDVVATFEHNLTSIKHHFFRLIIHSFELGIRRVFKVLDVLAKLQDKVVAINFVRIFKQFLYHLSFDRFIPFHYIAEVIMADSRKRTVRLAMVLEQWCTIKEGGDSI